MIVPQFASLFENNFEEGMEGLYEEANPFDLQRLMCDMAIYLSEFEPLNNSNLYIQFLCKLKSVLNDTIFSSLNYDLLFEDAVERIALKTNHFVEDKEGITFLKLHGSCNFLPPEGWQVTNNFIMGSSGISYPLRAASRKATQQFCNIKGTIYPAMALYMNSKPRQVSSDIIEDIQKRWEKYIALAKKILIIGVRPYTLDTHIWNPLSNTNARIGFIGSTQFHNWDKENRNGKDLYIGREWLDHFTESIEFLKS